MSNREYAVYIVTNRDNRVLYTGVTNNLERRIAEHRSKQVPGFTTLCNCTKLVWYEHGFEAIAAIEREKQIKGGSRARKIALIEAMNPEWLDLADSLE